MMLVEDETDLPRNGQAIIIMTIIMNIMTGPVTTWC